MRRSRWIVLGGCFLAYLFDALEIVLLSMALPTIRKDMGLTITQGGLLATATLIGIGVSSVLGGYVARQLRPGPKSSRRPVRQPSDRIWMRWQKRLTTSPVSAVPRTT
jgi:MFS family permease